LLDFLPKGLVWLPAVMRGVKQTAVVNGGTVPVGTCAVMVQDAPLHAQDADLVRNGYFTKKCALICVPTVIHRYIVQHLFALTMVVTVQLGHITGFVLHIPAALFTIVLIPRVGSGFPANAAATIVMPLFPEAEPVEEGQSIKLQPVRQLPAPHQAFTQAFPLITGFLLTNQQLPIRTVL
jgi:hypothetical protein